MIDSLKHKIEIYERRAIIRALNECGWVMARAARMLGITERMIGYKMKKYGIKMKGGKGGQARKAGKEVRRT